MNTGLGYVGALYLYVYLLRDGRSIAMVFDTLVVGGEYYREQGRKG